MGHARYVLAILFLANLFSVIDRSILGILAEPLRKDLGFTDTQLGVLSGFAFAVCYSLVGLPIARAIDKGSRTRILGAGIAIWSFATAACGFADNFYTMALARVGVGIGEATCFPAAMSLIADYFNKRDRTQAISIFQSSNFVGVVAGAILAGAIAQAWGWRYSFFVLGLPGVLLALLLFITVREPTRGAHEAEAAGAGAMTFAEGVRRLAADRGFMLLLIAAAMGAMALSVLAAWVPALLARAHGLSPGQVGAAVGPFVGIGGLLGVIGGGALATHISNRSGRPEAGLIVPALGALVAAPVMVFFIWSDKLPQALAAVGLANLLLSTYMGPVIAMAVGRAPLEGRAVASSLLLITQNLIGMGIGPFVVGVVSDRLMPLSGPVESLRIGLLVSPMALVAMSLVLLAARGRLRGPQAGTVAAAAG